MRHILVAAAIAVITLTGFFVFPGHTWLQSDTQIYVPMLEHIADPSLYQRELITSRPHLSFTIYDEAALLAHAVTRLNFKYVLLLEELLFRALGIWGVYLIARRFHESPAVALFIAGIVSLGATIVGPAVLSFEYEPVPRGFAIALLFCGIGLAIHGEIVWASVAASAASLYHAPTTLPFWILFGVVVLHGRRWTALVPPVAAAVILAVLAKLQPGVTEAQHFFTVIPPAIVELQRLRAPYNWVSQWPSGYLWHYGALWAIAMLALYRLRARLDFASTLMFAGLPALGLLSAGASYVLLDRMKLALIPQLQPARAVLFVTVCAVILCAIAGAAAAHSRRYPEAFLWMLAPFLVPIHRAIFDHYTMPQVVLIAGLAAMASVTLAMPRFTAPGAAMTVLAAMFLAPSYGGVANYAKIHSPQLDALAAWARTSTPKNSVFCFPNPGKDLRPGIFRVEALRAVYVDWKAGGQVNYFDDLGLEWWSRWQEVAIRKEIPQGVDYIVYRTLEAPPILTPAYRNDMYTAVRVDRPALADSRPAVDRAPVK